MSGAGWTRHGERGSPWLVRWIVGAVLKVGWRVGSLLIGPVNLYFFLTGPRVRAASREFLTRALGRPATVKETFLHLLTFSGAMFDRPFLLTGQDDGFQVEIVGLDLLEQVVGEGSGCLLLGAHCGSFDALRSIARNSPVKVKALMFRHEAGILSRVLEKLDPDSHDNVIQIGTLDAMLRIRESVARGELVGILADRVTSGEKFVMIPFLGAPAPFPTGPFILAAMLGAPVLLFSGIRTGARRYEVRFEPFAETIALRRASRSDDLRGWIERYAARLEAICRAHPYNWFNFYPFWEVPQDATPRT